LQQQHGHRRCPRHHRHRRRCHMTNWSRLCYLIYFVISCVRLHSFASLLYNWSSEKE
jgi:hypothetical protein